MPVKTKRASPQRHCSLCWRFHWSAADLILPAILLLALCTPVRTGAAPGTHGVREAPAARAPLSSADGSWRAAALCHSVCFPQQVKASVILPAAHRSSSPGPMCK